MSTLQLHDIAGQINDFHGKAESAAKTAIQYARQCGELLAEAKAQVGHGNWSQWLDGNFNGTLRSAQRYMKIASGWNQLESKTTRVSHLSIREAAKMLAEPKGPQRDEIIPPAGMMTDILTPSGSWCWIIPASQDGFYYVTTVEPLLGSDDWVATGTKRPVRADAIRQMMPPAFWFTMDDVKHVERQPWDYNEILFRSLEQWMDHRFGRGGNQ